MPENNNNDQPLDFAEKVLQSLKRQSRAVDLNEVSASSVSRDFTAYGSQEAGDPGPGSGGNKDIVIIPGFGGAAASSTSQVNFYWNAPAVPDSTGIDNNVRATLYNYAISATRPTLVIGGYDGTNQYKPIANYGTGTGITAKIWFHPFLGRIDADQFGFNTLASTGVSTVTGVLTWDTTQNRIRVGVAGTAKTIAFTDDISPFSGSATTASNLNLATSAAATNHFITMSASQTATGVAGAAISTVSTVFVVPNTGVVNASGFSGNVTGNVSGNQTGNMTGTVSGNVTGNVSGNVTGGVSGNVTGNVTGTVSGNVTGNVSGSLTGNVSGNVTGNVSGSLTGNVSGNVTGGVSGNVTGNVTGTVSGNVTGNVSGNVTGNLSGNVTGNVSGNLTGNVTGTAQTAGSTHTVLTAASGAHYLTFVPLGTTQQGAGVGQSIATAVTVAPNTGVISASGFSGNVTGTVSGNVTGNVSGNLTGNVSGNVTGGVSGNVTGNVTGAVSGNVTGNVSGNVTGNLSGNVTGNVSGNVTGNVSGNLTGNVTGTAQTAGSTHTVLTAASGAHYLTFVPLGTTQQGAGVGQSIATAVTVAPNTGVISASGFSGNVTGTVSGNLTGNVSGNITGNVSGTVTGNVSGNLTGNVSGNLTGNVSGTASTAQNVHVLAADAATGNHFLPFVRFQTSSAAGLSTDSTLYYDPANNTLYSTNFNGSFTGTISGVASTAANLVVNNAAENTDHYVLFSSRQTGSGIAVSSDSTFTINPSTNAMSMGTGSITANSVTVGSSARTVSTSAGNLILDSTGGQVDINDNVVISGNLTIQGTTVTVDSTVSTIVDPVIVVGSGVGGSHSTFDNNMDRGIEFRWSNAGTATTGFFGYSDTDGKFKFIPNATTVAGSNVYTGTVGTVQANLSGNVTGNVSGTVTGNVSGSVTGNVSGNLTGNVSGNVTGGVSGNVTGNVTGTVSGNVTGNVSGNLTGGVSGNVTGNVTGTVSGNVTGNVSGNLTGNVSGNLTGNVSGGVTGYVTGTAQTAGSTHTVLTAASGAHYITFVPLGTTQQGAGVGQSIATAVTVAPNTGVISASGFSGNVTGTVSGNVTGNVSGNLTGNVSGNVTGGVSGNVTGNITGTVSGNVTGNVSGNVTGNLSGNVTGNVSGNLTGNVSGNLTGNVTGTAQTAGSTHTVLTAASGAHYLTFVPLGTTQQGAGVGQSIATAVTVAPNTGVISASGFSGNVTGTVSGNVTGNLSGNVTGNVSGNVTGGVSGNVTGNVTGTVSGNVTGNLSGNVTGNVSGNLTGNVSGNLTGNVTGTAQTAGSTHTVLTAASGAHYLTFVPLGTTQQGAGVGQSIATAVTVAPNTGVISASGFSGNVTGTVSGNVTGNVSGNLTGNVSGNVTGGVSGNVTGNVTGTVSGNVTGNVSGSLTGNVSGNVTGNVSGNLTGNVSGTATTAQNLNVGSTAATTNYVLLSSLATGTGIAVSTKSSLVYNASTDTLTVPTIVGSGSGLTLTSTTAISNSSYLTIQTNSGDDNTTSDFFIRGINSTAVSKFSVDANGNLRATTKSFDIPHPTKEGKRLVYGVLEGPEHGVYHRGTVEGKGNILIELPEYWTQLVNDSYSIQLTPWGNYGVQILDKTPNSFIISATGNLLTKKFKLIKVDYIVHGSRKDAHLDIEQD